MNLPTTPIIIIDDDERDRFQHHNSIPRVERILEHTACVFACLRLASIPPLANYLRKADAQPR
jgi:hypothetical protein